MGIKYWTFFRLSLCLLSFIFIILLLVSFIKGYLSESDDKKWIRGINLFYDHEFPYVHQRYSAGLEIKSSVLELNSNFYQRISGDKTIGDTTERAMDGADIEFGIQLPYLPSSKLFFSAYEWQGND